MKIKISIDSTGDMPNELLEKHDISVVPLYIVSGEVSLRDGIDITPEDIFAQVEAGGGICGTAAVNCADYYAFFSEWLKEYDAIIHIHISSELSACYQNACLVAEELGGVYPVDSRSLSSGMAQLAMTAVDLREQGMDAKDIQVSLNEQRHKLDVSFVADTLTHLRKGGRCSALTALGANLLNLKPCIELKDGKMGVGKKYRGSSEKVLRQYVDDKLKNREGIDFKRICVTTTRMDDPELRKRMFEYIETTTGPWEEIYDIPAGCTISNHAGPNVLGVLFYSK